MRDKDPWNHKEHNTLIAIVLLLLLVDVLFCCCAHAEAVDPIIQQADDICHKPKVVELLKDTMKAAINPSVKIFDYMIKGVPEYHKLDTIMCETQYVATINTFSEEANRYIPTVITKRTTVVVDVFPNEVYVAMLKPE